MFNTNKLLKPIFQRLLREYPRSRWYQRRKLRIDVLESRRMLAVGSLDPSFSSDGRQLVSFGSPSDADAYDVAFQSDGKIVVVGESFIAGSDNSFAVTRLMSDGQLDTSFSSDGKAEVGFNLGPEGFENDQAQAVAIQSDGKILVAGYAERAANSYDIAIVRLNSDGSLDTSFDSDGRKTVSLSANGIEVATSLLVLSDGKILVGGGFQAPSGSLQGFVLRLTSAGALDTTFGAGSAGYTAITFHDSGNDGGIDAVADLALDSSGRIIAVGSSYSASGDYDLGIARLTASGSLSTSFGDDETVGGTNPDGTKTLAIDFGASADDYATGVKIASDGKIYVAGYFAVGFSITDLSDNFVLARFTSSGLLDTTYAFGQGYTNTAFDLGTNDEDYRDQAQELMIQPDGKVVLVGTAQGDGSHARMAIARFNTTGTIDFKTTVSFGSGYAEARELRYNPMVRSWPLVYTIMDRIRRSPSVEFLVPLRRSLSAQPATPSQNQEARPQFALRCRLLLAKT